MVEGVGAAVAGRGGFRPRVWGEFGKPTSTSVSEEEKLKALLRQLASAGEIAPKAKTCA